jgi:hypothetical protein
MISQPELLFLQKVYEFVRSDVLRAVKTLTVVMCVVTPLALQEKRLAPTSSRP